MTTKQTASIQLHELGYVALPQPLDDWMRRRFYSKASDLLGLNVIFTVRHPGEEATASGIWLYRFSVDLLPTANQRNRFQDFCDGFSAGIYFGRG